MSTTSTAPSTRDGVARTVGRVWTAAGSGTGCSIGPRLVLTASHVVNWLDGGGAGWIKFSW